MPHFGSAKRVLEQLRERGETLAVAESLTGGELLSRLIDIPGASQVVKGGIVAYSNAVKIHSLGVDAELLSTSGAVTEEVALQMARGVRDALDSSGADYGVATTGVAGPDYDPQTGQPPGLVYVAVAGPFGTVWSERLGLVGDRAQIRQGAVLLALGLLEDALGLSPSME